MSVTGDMIDGMVSSEAYEALKKELDKLKFNWLPTPDNVNSLPEGLRQYVHDIETNADPASMVQELTLAKDTIKSMEQWFVEYEKEWSDEDKTDKFSAIIEKYNPARGGPDARHDLMMLAMELISPRKSKFSIVFLLVALMADSEAFLKKGGIKR